MFKKGLMDSFYAALKLVAEMPAHSLVHAATEGLPWWVRAILGAAALLGIIALPVIVELMHRSYNRQTPPQVPQAKQGEGKKRGAKK